MKFELELPEDTYYYAVGVITSGDYWEILDD